MKLPVSPFEHFMLADDRPSHPMTFHVRTLVDGQFSPDEMVKAYDRVLPAHPLLRSRIVGQVSGQRGQLHWDVDGALPHVPAQIVDADTQIPNDGIDLTQTNGARLFVIPRRGGTELVLQLHHACCDGLGAVHFLLDLVAEATGMSSGVCEASATELLAERARYVIDHPVHQHIFASLGRQRRYLTGWPQPVAVPDECSRMTPTANAPVCSVHLSHEMTARVLAAATAAGVSVNDLLLRDFFSILHEINVQNQGARTIRIAVPTNLRQSHHQNISCSNVVSMTFLDRHRGEFENEDRLLQTIRAEMVRIKKYFLGLSMVHTLSVLGRLPYGIRIVTAQRTQHTCRSSAVFSNLGRIIPSDDRKAEALRHVRWVKVYPPVRPNTRFALAACTVHDRVMLTLNHDPTTVTQAFAAEVLDRYVARLGRSVG